MKVKELINYCIMLLWVVALHHCVLEQLFNHERVSFSLATESSSGCPAHSSEDPSSHKEGKICEILLQVSNQTDLTQIVVPFFNVLIAIFGGNLDFNITDELGTQAPIDTANAAVQHLLAHSLSIAANAPPVKLA